LVLVSEEEKMMPDIGDIIEVVTDIPEKNLRAGVRGTVAHCHGEDHYEVEFADKDGETLNFLALHAKQFIVVWRAETRQSKTPPCPPPLHRLTFQKP
jgi:hypothetical protein